MVGVHLVSLLSLSERPVASAPPRGGGAPPLRRLLRGVALSVVDVGADAPLPERFRLFRAGVNETTKGPLLFDAAAAAAVLAAFERGGVDLMIDLAHDSLDPAAHAARDDADDARGWFRLAVRDGELWAVDVTWTADGERRLRSRTQRYVSPAVLLEPTEDGADRVVEVINCALCSMPATLDAMPLVAARTVRLENTMDPKIIKDALDALEAGDSGKALEILKSLIASAAGAPVEAAPAAEPDPTEESADPPAAPAGAALRRTPAADAETIKLRAEVARLAADLDARDLAERQTLVGRLVVLGAELPATAWDGDPEKRVPCERLSREPIETLRARVEALAAARPAPRRNAPPTRTELTPGETRHAARMTAEQRERYEGLRALRRH